MQKVTDSLIGLGGIASVEVVSTVPVLQSTDYSSIVQTLIQIAIGVVTLLGLFRKKRV